MILRDNDTNTIGPATSTGLLHERLIEEKIENGNISITAGGKSIKQADSDFFKFAITARCTLAQFETINTIAMNKTYKKYYTPRRALQGESTIREVEVIFQDVPNVQENKIFSNDIIEFTATMIEVIE